MVFVPLRVYLKFFLNDICDLATKRFSILIHLRHVKIDLSLQFYNRTDWSLAASARSSQIMFIHLRFK